jgi:hypothetical protein
MTKTIVKTVLQKAKSDPRFLAMILKDPKSTLSAYNLTKVDFDTIVKTVKYFETYSIWPGEI